MNAHNKKLMRRLATMRFNLEWAKDAAHAARGWVEAGKEDSMEFQFCFREALNGARSAVREGAMIERILHSKRKGSQ